MFWDKVAGVYDLFENLYNRKVYTETGKKVCKLLDGADNVIHLLPNPQKAMEELMRVCRKNGKVIIPTYINDSEKTSRFAVRLLEKMGADFKRQFDAASYKDFFAGLGLENVEYVIVEGRMPCDIAIITIQ